MPNSRRSSKNERKRFSIPSPDEKDDTPMPSNTQLFRPEKRFKHAGAFHRNSLMAVTDAYPISHRPGVLEQVRAFYTNPYLVAATTPPISSPCNINPIYQWPQPSYYTADEYRPSPGPRPSSPHIPFEESQAEDSKYFTGQPSASSTLIFPSQFAHRSASESEVTCLKVVAQLDNDEHKEATKGARWTDEETRFLIAIWQKRYPSIGKKRNAAMWKEIAKELNNECSSNGIKTIRTGPQCKNKMKNLIDEYKRVCDTNGTSGNNRPRHVYFDAINEILSTRDATNPTHLAEVGLVQDDPSAHNSEEENDYAKQRNSPSLFSVNISSSSSSFEPKRKGKKAKRAKIQDDSDELTVLMKYLEESEKREQAFLLKLAEMDKEHEERQQERSLKMMAEIAKILTN